MLAPFCALLGTIAVYDVWYRGCTGWLAWGAHHLWHEAQVAVRVLPLRTVIKLFLAVFVLGAVTMVLVGSSLIPSMAQLMQEGELDVLERRWKPLAQLSHLVSWLITCVFWTLHVSLVTATVTGAVQLVARVAPLSPALPRPLHNASLPLHAALVSTLCWLALNALRIVLTHQLALHAEFHGMVTQASMPWAQLIGSTVMWAGGLVVNAVAAGGHMPRFMAWLGKVGGVVGQNTVAVKSAATATGAPGVAAAGAVAALVGGFFWWRANTTYGARSALVAEIRATVVELRATLVTSSDIWTPYWSTFGAA